MDDERYIGLPDQIAWNAASLWPKRDFAHILHAARDAYEQAADNGGRQKANAYLYYHRQIVNAIIGHLQERYPMKDKLINRTYQRMYQYDEPSCNLDIAAIKRGILARSGVLLCYLMLLSVTAIAGEVTLEWDASISPEVTGYKLHVGPTPGAYTRTVDVGNVLIFKLLNLADGTHYIAASAYDGAGNESDYSNEVSAVIQAPTLAITSLSASMRWFGVVLLCTTSVNASAILRYTDLDTGEKQTVIATPDATKTQHRAVLYLNMGQQKYYRYQWEVTDASGNSLTDGATFQIR